jgi:hypothetical protein
VETCVFSHLGLWHGEAVAVAYNEQMGEILRVSLVSNMFLFFKYTVYSAFRIAWETAWAQNVASTTARYSTDAASEFYPSSLSVAFLLFICQMNTLHVRNEIKDTG